MKDFTPNYLFVLQDQHWGRVYKRGDVWDGSDLVWEGELRPQPREPVRLPGGRGQALHPDRPLQGHDRLLWRFV